MYEILLIFGGFVLGFFTGIQPKISRTAEDFYNNQWKKY